MSADPDLFRDGRLGFELRKPAHWRFLPPAWSPVERAKRNPDSDDWIRMAGKPFCCAMHEHSSLDRAFPTLQVTCRPHAAPPLAGLPAILDTLVSHAASVHETLEVEELLPYAVVAGFPAVGWRGTCEIIAVKDGADARFGVRSRNYVVFARNLAYTIGLSGSDDPEHYDEADFDAILASVRIR